MLELPDDAACLGCGYRLRGLGEARCPECGRPFDPRRFASFDSVASRRLIARNQRRLARSRGLRLSLWLTPGRAAGFAWIAVAVLGIGVWPMWLGLHGWLVLAVVLAALAAADGPKVMRRLRELEPDAKVKRLMPVRWLWLALGLSLLKVPLLPMFWLHWPLLDAAADQPIPIESVYNQPAGLYVNLNAHRCGHGVHLNWFLHHREPASGPGFFRRDTSGVCHFNRHTIELSLGNGWWAKVGPPRY